MAAALSQVESQDQAEKRLSRYGVFSFPSSLLFFLFRFSFSRSLFSPISALVSLLYSLPFTALRFLLFLAFPALTLLPVSS